MACCTKSHMPDMYQCVPCLHRTFRWNSPLVPKGVVPALHWFVPAHGCTITYMWQEGPWLLCTFMYPVQSCTHLTHAGRVRVGTQCRLVQLYTVPGSTFLYTVPSGTISYLFQNPDVVVSVTPLFPCFQEATND